MRDTIRCSAASDLALHSLLMTHTNDGVPCLGVEPQHSTMNADVLPMCYADEFCDVACLPRGGSRISQNGFHMFKGVGFALLILSHFSSPEPRLKVRYCDRSSPGVRLP